LILFTQLIEFYVSCRLVNYTVEENDPKVNYIGTGVSINNLIYLPVSYIVLASS